MKYLLDASAIYPLALKLGEKFLDHADRFVILDLTIYEVGNALWKEYRLGKIKNLDVVAQLFEMIFENVKMLRIELTFHEILNLAMKENLTFYDASYLHMARRYGMKLVTEDADLLKFEEAINVRTLLSELGSTS
ncbi:MAG: PIN domain nuclease [Thermoprotei archaeon]|nr:MAG: PIN domain nuclease [Thermoprotei archaeon]RLF24776.1 MAG: PIN domain nuclease [Thermoprotei archaeon]